MKYSISILSGRVRFLGLLLAVAMIAAACGSDDGVAFEGVELGSATIVSEAEIDFTEISPFATFGSAQGDFGTGAHGTFGIFGEGAASPPHTHSGNYYAVVIDGEMNNPFGTEADPPTLPPGSFWAVPANEEHLTACLTPDDQCRFFFHSGAGFDFFQLDEFSEARSNEAASIPVDNLEFEALAPYSGSSVVWGNVDAGPFGMIVRLDQGSGTGQLAHRNDFTLVPLTGNLTIETDDEARRVVVGSLLESEANVPHQLQCDSGTECLFYLFSDGPLVINRG